LIEVLHSGNLMAKQWALKALAGTTNYQNKVVLANGIRPMVTLYQSKDPVSRQLAAQAVCTLCEYVVLHHGLDHLHKFINQGAIHLIAQELEKDKNGFHSDCYNNFDRLILNTWIEPGNEKDLNNEAWYNHPGIYDLLSILRDSGGVEKLLSLHDPHEQDTNSGPYLLLWMLAALDSKVSEPSKPNQIKASIVQAGPQLMERMLGYSCENCSPKVARKTVTFWLYWHKLQPEEYLPVLDALGVTTIKDLGPLRKLSLTDLFSGVSMGWFMRAIPKVQQASVYRALQEDAQALKPLTQSSWWNKQEL